MQMRLRWGLKSLINGRRGFLNVLCECLRVNEKMLLIRNGGGGAVEKIPLFVGPMGHTVIVPSFFAHPHRLFSHTSVFTKETERL